MAHYEVFREDAWWFWRLVLETGTELARSVTGYGTKKACLHSILAFRRIAEDARVDYESFDETTTPHRPADSL